MPADKPAVYPDTRAIDKFGQSNVWYDAIAVPFFFVRFGFSTNRRMSATPDPVLGQFGTTAPATSGRIVDEQSSCDGAGPQKEKVTAVDTEGEAGEDVQGEGIPHPDATDRVSRSDVLQVSSAEKVYAVPVPQLEELFAWRFTAATAADANSAAAAPEPRQGI